MITSMTIWGIVICNLFLWVILRHMLKETQRIVRLYMWITQEANDEILKNWVEDD